MSSQQWGRVRGRLMACFLAATAALSPVAWLPSAAGQTPPLQVVILRPNEGEVYYAAPSAPRTQALIAGKVSGGSFDAQQLGVELAILQNGKSVGRLSGSADASGSFSFRVSISINSDARLATPSNCFVCHENARVELPAGESVVRVTVVEPTGAKAVAERRVVLDQSVNAMVAVRVTIQGEEPSPEGWPSAVRGLPVEAATRLYEWRGRKFQAATDAQGRATLEVEALALAPTRYLFSVAPIVVDGVLYQTGTPVEIVLPPGVKSAGPITLAVEAQRAHISGAVSLAGKPLSGPLSVRAVALPYGDSFAAPVTALATGGEFSLANLPIGTYLVTADPDQAAALGYGAATKRLEMARQANAACPLDLAPLRGRSVYGVVRDVSGTPLPFGWVESEEHEVPANRESQAAPTSPISGAFALHGISAGVRTLHVVVPGYWSRVIPARSGAALDVHLEMQPDSLRLPWGSGSLFLPAETDAAVAGERISLRRGWLWGTGDQPLTIELRQMSVTIRNGAFALEHLPGERSWLYVTAGEAEVSRLDEPPVAVKGGEMAALAGGQVAGIRPVRLDEAAFRLLVTQNAVPVRFAAAPGAWARVEEWLAVLGLMDVRPNHVAFGAGAAFVMLAAGLAVLRRFR